MKALVINLDKATERMVFQEQQLNALNIEYDRLPAVSTDDLTDSTYQQYYATWERPLRRTEVACFLSHKKAWESVISENCPMLILEDDAVLAKNSPCVLKELEALDNIDLTTLEARGRKKIVAKKSSSQFCHSSLIRLYQDRTGAAGYVLWPKGARILLNKARKGHIALADAFISSTYTLNAYQVEPATIVQLDQCESYGIAPPISTLSSIDAEEKPSLGKGKIKAQRWQRLVSQLRLAFRHISVFPASKRRYISIAHSHDF